MNWIRESDEVFYSREPLVIADGEVIGRLKQAASANARRRVRLCVHPDVTDRLHEMLIVYTRDTYVCPHKHLNKSESFHLLEGIADVLFLDEGGKLANVCRLTPYHTAGPFYYRMNRALYHSFVFHSDFVVFFEITNGPFNRADTQPAPWAPAESDAAAALYFTGLKEQAARWQRRS